MSSTISHLEDAIESLGKAKRTAMEHDNTGTAMMIGSTQSSVRELIERINSIHVDSQSE